MMNRNMYPSNCQNQMMNNCGRPMQRSMYRPDCCRPTQQTTPCHKEQHQDSCQMEHHKESCRPMHHDSCGCSQENTKPMPCMPKPESCKQESCPEKPKYSRSQMLQYINETSFAVNDILLYLDTHPCDREAMKFYEKNVAKRKAALRDFAKFYGPLTVDTADDARNETWEWVMQPWPWEGRDC